MGETAGACGLRRCGDKTYYCSVELTLRIIGGKWKPIILFYLHQNGTRRFGELKKHMPNITQKMLTQQLRELEADGMISRRVYPEVPPKVEYSLTKTGKSVGPILEQLCGWGRSYEKLHAGGEIDPDVLDASA